ncbi:MAG: hypothetical protein LBI14_02310 [Treponema sp.]|jgi:hypothetical protein|nr:hypothetical protein [Treponema sp.]
MKKLCFILVFLVFAASSASLVAAEVQNISLYIEGSADSAEHLEFFTNHFTIEATVKGYVITRDRASAQNTLRFDVLPNIILYDDGTEEQAPSSEGQFIIRIEIRRNSDDAQLVSFDFPFTDLETMNEYTQNLFTRAVVSIPLPEEIIIDTWRNKWIYIRASLEFPITFYVLKGPSVAHDLVTPGITDMLDNKTMAMPAATIGVEVQFLNFMSIEPKFQIAMENLGNTQYFSMAAGLEIKFPLKFIRHVMLEPYIAGSYPLFVSPTFLQFPLFGVGGGVQLGIKMGSSGILFLDINYMYFFRDAETKNYLGPTWSPSVIPYQRSVIGIGIGYKFGFIDRR